MSLTDSVKNAVEKSGFPLEMEIQNYLQKNQWNCKVGNNYLDFETEKYREYDIIASKEINTVEVNLYISCKKSSEKQIVLYTPANKNPKLYFVSPVKAFPKPGVVGISKHGSHPFLKFNILNDKRPFAINIITTSGNTINNLSVEIISSINGLLKASVLHLSDGRMETDWRTIDFYFLIFSGNMYCVSLENEIKLEEIDYCVYNLFYPLKISDEMENYLAVKSVISEFGKNHLIEFCKPEKFREITLHIEEVIKSFDKNFFEKWGYPTGSI